MTDAQADVPRETSIDERTLKDLHYGLYLRRFYLQQHPVEWNNVEIVMARIDRLLDRHNAQQAA